MNAPYIRKYFLIASFFLFFSPNSIMNIDQISIDPSWKQVLLSEFQKPYFAGIKDFLLKEFQA